MRNRSILVALVATALGGGCRTVCDRGPDAIPVRRLPDEVLRAPACGPGCETVVQANKPAVKQVKGEAPPGVTSDPPPFGCASVAGCGSCAVYYTGGALGPGSHLLKPDMRVTEAVAAAHGPLIPSAGCAAPSRVTVIRRLATGQQLTIRVDLVEALRDPRENIPIWPGDTILTSETACETAGRAFGGAFRLGAGLPVRVLAGGVGR